MNRFKHYRSYCMRIMASMASLAGIGLVAWIASALIPPAAAADFVVYSVYKPLDMGNPGEPAPQKDYYVNMGRAQGIREGTVLEVSGKIATYDLLSEKLYKEIVFPIARLKVIHSEGTASVARLEKMESPEKTPAISPRAVMIGDLVSPAE